MKLTFAQASKTPVLLATSLALVACDEPDVLGFDDLPSAFDEVDEDLSVLNDDELDAMAESGEETSFRITGGYADGSVHREVVWIPTLGCSGVVLSERYILTAAHCVDGQIGWPLATRGSLGNITVRYSTNGIAQSTVYNGTAQVAIDPHYAGKGGAAPELDVALIQLGGDMSQFVRARWHSSPVEPNIVAHDVVGWGNHESQAGGSGSSAGTSRRMGIMYKVGWDPLNGIRLEAGSVPDPGDSGGGYFVRPGIWTRILVGTHSCTTGCDENADAKGPRVSTHVAWILLESMLMGRPLSCSSASLYGVPYYYGCSD